MWLLPLRRTARATWSRHRSSATSGSAHPARPRMPFPGHSPDREPASGQSPRCTRGDSRHESAPPANYARRGQVGHRAVVRVPGAVSRRGDARVRQTDDACIGKVAGACAALPSRSPWTNGRRSTDGRLCPRLVPWLRSSAGAQTARSQVVRSGRGRAGADARSGSRRRLSADAGAPPESDPGLPAIRLKTESM
jgi:hypothetical protein